MRNTDTLYLGCPIQFARQFISGKWQMGILWNLREQPMNFSAIKNQLPDLSDKILMQELNFFVDNNIVYRNTIDFPTPKTEYTLTAMGKSLIPLITSIVEWGYEYLQDAQVTKEMSMTPRPIIEAIENTIAEKS